MKSRLHSNPWLFSSLTPFVCATLHSNLTSPNSITELIERQYRSAQAIRDDYRNARLLPELIKLPILISIKQQQQPPRQKHKRFLRAFP